MPQCPHCKTPYEFGKQYCDVCESYLLHPEEGDTFCPNCDIRVSSRQEICHKCDTPLLTAEAARTVFPQEPSPGPGEVSPPPPDSPPPAAPEPGEPPPARAKLQALPNWVTGLLIGGGVVIVVLVALVIILFSRGPAPPPSTPPVAQVAPTPAVPPAPTTPPAPAPGPEMPLKEQLSDVLNKLRDAQMKRDIFLYMSCYSYTFPTLDTQRREILKTWENYHFTNLVYFLEDVKSLGLENATAKVTWEIQVQNRRTQDFENFTSTYKVGFAKELGAWRIRSLEELD